jgi:hypothetical protein
LTEFKRQKTKMEFFNFLLGTMRGDKEFELGIGKEN